MTNDQRDIQRNLRSISFLSPTLCREDHTRRKCLRAGRSIGGSRQRRPAMRASSASF